MYQELRETLVRYRKGNSEARVQIYLEALARIEKIQADTMPKTPEELIEMTTQLGYMATLTNYAQVLHDMDHGQYFDILFDFRMPKVFDDTRFAPLKQYFEFHPTAPQMKLLMPRETIPSAIWHLFREAQIAHMSTWSPEKRALWRFDLDIDNLPDDQLYPLPIQMFGQLHNEAVDRINCNPFGQYRFAFRFGSYLLPGGGMIEINLHQDLETRMTKMLDEHLEEERGDLWHDAAAHYNQLDNREFCAQLHHILKDYPLKIALDPAKSNAVNLALVVEDVSDAMKTETESKKIQALRALRAQLQVEPFKQTTIYQEALVHIKSNTEIIDIEQLGDVRAAGGYQVSHCFLMTGEPLEDWFDKRLGSRCVLADDLTGGEIKHLTLFQAIKQATKVKFSHLLIALTHQTRCLDGGKLTVPAVWDPLQSREATASVLEEGRKMLKRITPCPLSVSQQHSGLFYHEEAGGGAPPSMALPDVSERRLK